MHLFIWLLTWFVFVSVSPKTDDELFCRSQSKRWIVAHCESCQRGSANHFECGWRAIMQRWTMGTCGIKRQLLLWRLVSSPTGFVIFSLKFPHCHTVLCDQRTVKLKGVSFLCHYRQGCPPTECHIQAPAFEGCMQLISINNHLVNLTHVQKGLLGNYNELQFDTCNMKDR